MWTALRRFAARLRAHVGGAEQDREFAEELASHLAMLTHDNISRGLAPGEAARQARLTLGAASSLAVRHRDVRTFRWLDDLAQDLRFAARLMLKDRWLSAAAILAIALGIGANTMGFSIVNAAFIRGFPFESAGELHSISWRSTAGRRLAASVLDLEDWRSQSRSFRALGAAVVGAVNISDGHAAPQQAQGARVTANLFEVLGQRPLLGRTFGAAENRQDGEPVVVIGHDIWSTRYARDPNVIGRVLRVNGRPATIIGVMPERMKFPDNSELWVPFVPTADEMAREERRLSVFGRLAPQVTKAQASVEMEAVAQRVITAHPTLADDVAGAQVETLVERFLGGAARSMFTVIMGAVMFVLLIACANVASLLLSRAAHRSREIAVRYALGATRSRILRQLLIESVALASLGGIAGLVLASYGVQAFDAAIHATGAPYWLRFTIDYRVLAYVVAICVATGVIFGLAPALQVSREHTQDTLKEGARGAAGNRRAGRLGSVMVISELALTVVLLCGAGLLLRSFMALYAVPPGFDLAGLTRVEMQLPESRYPDAGARRRFFDRLLSDVDVIPGIERAAITTAVPPRDDAEWRVVLAGSPHMEDDQRPSVSTVAVSPRYFDTLGVRVSRGRGFEPANGESGAAHVVINQLMADRFFPGEDPIGRQLRLVPLLDDRNAPPQPWRTIVGVTPTFQQGNDTDAFRNPVVYLPILSAPGPRASLVIRSPLPPADVVAAVREVMRAIDADQPVFSIETLGQVFANERSLYRIFATLFAVLAAIGLALSAVGTYGVIAYAVAQRTREIGVRMAIGASRRDVTWLFLRKGLLQLAVALAIGLPAALGLGAVTRLRLVDIEAHDPVTVAAITALLSAVALIACVLPARKAAHVDPLTALRAE
jgi:putative ABC transport system permease protein